ncbi:hypothetical protein [Streptomyces nojiriensis]|nr:hypothetical protein [Streptomyces nojiriensis]QTI43609.1 hypothetical protein JYK04_01371 [Streptomyces nojiriensis]
MFVVSMLRGECMDPDDVMIDALADKILGGKVGGALHLPFRWKQKNAPRRAYSPIHVEANTPVRSDLSCRLDLRFRIGLDKPWEYSLILLHPGSRTVLRRLDVRGTHLDRETGEHFINRTHKHRWSEQRGNRDVYAPDDIRHAPDPIANATLTSMDEEHDRVVRDFVLECKMDISAGYVWFPPTPPMPAPTLEGFEEYP